MAQSGGGAVLRDRTAVAGVGWTEYTKNSGVSTLALALRAVRAALDDAGLEHSDVDGVACHRVGDSASAVLVAHVLGIRDLRFHLDMFGGGGTSHQVVAQAALAVASGIADTVVCWRAVNARSEFRMGGTGRAAPDAPEFQYQLPYGYATPPQQFAMLDRAWRHARGATAEDLGRVAIAQRAHAALNDRAMMRKPLTMDEYLSSRLIADPLRLYDCCLETDAAVALVVTGAERARDLRQTPVLVSGAATGGGHTLFSNGRADPTVSAAADLAPRLYAAAGIGPETVDVAELYDAFTFLVPLQLEDYGLVPRGETGGFYADGHASLGGRLPVNTHGGHLSEGYVHGLNHVAEAVTQLRGTAGERQVPGAEVALTTGQPGYVGGTSSALVLRRDG
ncbi:thiolase C-terminal domain-containing protein [Yinghuangia seranimata]|uniref:thiolase C-terminal domain-containing protein n=1 Tax=Yinghuangia seranimata TaxID=408067 RepID=UPI00248CDDC3|nr:lipid-transfer protein [Yinghuangia seranimata]MDI2127183.1 lipid-transfer protein [Yinghuangia seranimata]